MLERLARLYTAYMAQDVRSPIPHVAGPPGVGKSENAAALAKLVGKSQAAEQLAKLVQKKLHIINVSRLSPLEIEGIQMPIENKLEMLHSTLWTQLQEGDVVLLDEFLRGFPEVYNALLDIFTSRHVAGFDLRERKTGARRHPRRWISGRRCHAQRPHGALHPALH